jgi:hypothetical protein
MKLPAFQFYPADWRKDPGVQSLPYFERGIWFEILCLMHESEQRGKLILNGRPMPDEALSRLLGLDKQILTKTLTTLLEYGVASRDGQGVLMNRRMVNDENLRKIRQESGKKGGNPVLVKQKPTKTKKRVKQKSTPSSSSSSSSSTSVEKDKKIATTAQPADAQWLDSLTEIPAYKQLNVPSEIEKAKIWADANERELTRKFVVDWLNRAKPTDVGNQNATNNFRQQRANEAVESRNRRHELKRKLAATTNGKLLPANVPNRE